MNINYEIIVFSSLFLITLGIIFSLIVKKRKRSAKNIYKLIDDLEKKYIYYSNSKFNKTN